MIEIHHEIIRFGHRFNEILCCDCFYDEVYFLLRQKVDYYYFEENFEKYDNCFINFFDETIVVVCGDVLNFIRESKYKLTKKYCIEDVIWCLKIKIVLCSVCIIELFRKINILHLFKLKW